MLRTELVERLAEDSIGLKKTDVKYIVDIFFDQISGALLRGERVELRGFGAFTTKHRPARVARNPRDGTVITVKERRFVHFKSGKQLNQIVNDG